MKNPRVSRKKEISKIRAEIVFGLIFRSLIHFEFIFVCDVRK